MDTYTLAAIAILGLLIYLQQTALKTYVKLQTNISSEILDYLKKNKLKSLLEFLIVIASLLCLFGGHFNEWIPLFAVAFALFSLWALSRLYWMESNPSNLLKGYEKEAFQAIAKVNESELCKWVEAIHEVAFKALTSSSMPIATAALNSELSVGKQFLVQPNTLDLPKIGYVLFFIFERLNTLFEKGLANKQESFCTQVNTTFGKLALQAMSTHPHFAGYALNFAGKLAEKAVKAGMKEIGIKTSFMLLEVTKSVVNEVSLDDYDLRESLVLLVKNLEEISKEIYRQDKNTPLDSLKEPLLQLKTILAGSKNSAHPTILLAINEVDRVLAEFQELELILKTLPPIS